MKKYIVVTVGYHNIITGRSAHKVFLIAFEDKGNGIVMSTMSKWRTRKVSTRILGEVSEAPYGKAFRICFITPLPTTWFGRQPNGCVQTILGILLCINSSISPVRNHPSPV